MTADSDPTGTPRDQSTGPEVDGDGDGFDMVDLVEEHIESTIGPIEYVYHELGFADPHIDVYYVAPGPDREFHTFVTGGMSSRAMNTHGEVEGKRFAELMIVLPPEWPVSDDALKQDRYAWPVGLLRSLAHYPHDNDTWFSIGHSIPNGDPALPLGEGVDWKAVLLLPSVLLPDVGQMMLPSGQRVNFLCMVPLYTEELELKVERGSVVLLELFDQHGVNELIRPGRVNVARRRRWWHAR
ncbi:MAG TPA: suppressor of fused domain protein [Longimicrobium sp.]|nr:suppressor of fused domain protein [Longimicrobium sp.]